MKFDRRDFLKILPVAPTIISAAETKSYRGMNDSAGWRADAHKRIEQHRKDDFKVRIIESVEKPVKNLKVDISLYRHHFGFGAILKKGFIDTFQKRKHQPRHSSTLIG